MDKQTLLQDLYNSNGIKLTNYVIVSGNHYTFESAINEMLSLSVGTKLLKWLSPISALMYIPNGYIQMLHEIDARPPIFIQHISPVQYIYKIEDSKEVLEFVSFVKKSLESDISSKPFSVQTTIFNSDNFSAYEVNHAVSDSICKLNITLDVKNPVQVISLGIDSDVIYLGLSQVKDNLSKWACGIPHYSKSINRAENKLLECKEYFNISLSGGCALDIGAAPGGWTKVMSDFGYEVWAVDPAELDLSISRLNSVTHVKKTAQKFLSNNNIIFDVIVNDMVMDCRESANIMNHAANSLSNTGYAVMTAKLPKKGYNKRLKTALKILSQGYHISGVRQLPSNKSEVTILLSKSTK